MRKSNFEFSINLSAEDVYDMIIDNFSRDEIVELFKRIDDYQCDLDFTKSLAEHFTKVVVEEESGESQVRN